MFKTNIEGVIKFAVSITAIFFSFSFLNLNGLPLFLFLAVLILFLDTNRGFLVLVYTFPFYGVLVVPGIGVYIPYLAFILIIKATFFNLLNFKKDIISAPFFIFAISLAISFFINPIDFYFFVKSILIIGIIIVLRMLVTPKEIDKILIFYAIACVASVFIGVLSKNYTEMYVGGILVQRFIGCVSDPNYYTRALLFAIAYIYYLLLVNKSRRVKIVLLTLLLLLVYGMSLAFSKMGFIVLLIISFIFIFKFILKNKKFHFKILYLFSIIGLMSTVFLFIDFSLVLERFSSSGSNVSDLTTGRFDLQIHAIKKWLNGGLGVYLLGFGFNSSLELTKDLYFIENNVLHSVPLQTIVEQGLLGGLSLFILIKRLYLKSKGVLFLSFIVFFVTSFALSGLFYWDLVLYYIVFNKFNLNKLTKVKIFSN